ncbi:sensor histidine kinase [Agromyces laixinhei]|uniref:sensor histidine kinase n=1 Tax=Agromyces laixinhei TaxID=2585717 RepID=UPI002FC2B23E
MRIMSGNPQPSDEATPGEQAARTLSAMVRSMQAGQHLITALLLIIGAGRALADGTQVALILVSSLAFAGWYLGGAILASRTRDRALGAWWLVGLAVIWVGTVAASVEFVWLAFSLWLLAGHLLRWRWAVVFSVVVFAVVAATPLVHTGTTSYANLIGPLVGGVFALGISRGYVELIRDARERQRLVASLVQAQAEMADLHEELAHTQRESGAMGERTRLSRDIHDTIAQGLSSVTLLVHAELENHPESESARVLRQIESIAGDSLNDVRRIVAALAPGELEAGALAGALRRMLDRLAEETGLQAELHVDDGFPALPTAAEVALLRTAQSALANVRLHAGAKRVVVSLADVEDAIRLDIVDDGRGFDAGVWDTGSNRVELGGYGLHSMRARLRELGGGLDVESAPGEGTALSAHVPLGRTMEER